MGSLFRSEEMTLCQLFLQSEAAYTCVSELGELGLVQFRDLNPDVNAFQRKFVNEVRRCDEMERKLRFLEKEIKKDDIPMLDTGDNPDAPQPREMIDLEATFEKLENEMKEVNANAEALKRNFLELTELRHILRKTQGFFDEAMHDPTMTEENVGLLGEDALRVGGQPLRLGFVAGVIHRERIPAFERMLWRVCRGNVFLKQAEIESPLEDPVTGEEVRKSVFIIFFQGDQLKSRVKKICEGFRATLYPCPEQPAERREMAVGVMTRIEDLNTVLGQTQDHRRRVLVAAAKNVKVWFLKVRKIKAIYHTLNMFNLDVTQKCLIAECWCAVNDLDKIQLALRRGTERSGSSVPSILNRMTTKQDPPTYNRTNKFTSAFQAITNAYGVANYREVNPAPFAIISFPFLFSVMFGDWGHGIIMFLFALWMVIMEKQLGKKSDNEIWNTFFGGRYIILLMGIFSIYSGLLYNDCFAKPFNIFGYSWNHIYDEKTIRESKTLMMDPNSTAWREVPYYFGLDPMWQLSSNKITFLNSFKMKMAVILGIGQMFFGVCLSLFNHRYFRRPINIYCEFIPGVIFLLSIFGYLVVLVFYKWVNVTAAEANCAPSLLIDFINMFLMKYGGTCSTAMFYKGQEALQKFLVAIAVICIPWMLMIKPFYLRHVWGKKTNLAPLSADGPSGHLSVNSGDISINDQQGGAAGDGQTNSSDVTNHHDGMGKTLEDDDPLFENGEFDFGDTFIHQAIHTIEYCLGCVSNTASYLRLWALSLAHAQLSEVLWQMVMRNALGVRSWIGALVMVFVFAAWAVLTVMILLLMEGLSAFLHTLRLHWVEFQNKFYIGAGYLFEPFSFEAIMDVSGPDDN